jgi:flagellar basal-body rod modification protein FlgD
MTDDGSVRGRLDIAASTGGVTVRIQDAVGQVVREIELGPASAGSLDFTWDGLDDSGEHVEAGYYQVTAEMLSGQGTQSLPIDMYARVDSVSLGASSGGLTLNLEGLGPVAFDSISQIY